ncbi:MULTISPECIES: hypothetical protein [Kribbella]|uniref:MYXO-CTERM domain-containing protein n=1 Tax=Kribbella sancticallisti TaxID=460087 RepID=A0ABN2EE67_9ACTN|nr:hypothetical protein [Kribbella catacumbae]
MSKAVAQSSRRGSRWRATGVLCALIFGIIGLYSLESHCSESGSDSGSHAAVQVAHHADSDVHAAASRTGDWMEQADPLGDGDLMACALFAGLVALLLAAIRARRRSGSWLVPAVRGRLRHPRQVRVVSVSVRAISPLRC